MSDGGWYHAHVEGVSRGKGKSAVGLVAYVTGQNLKDEETGTWCKRNHPGEVLAWATEAPFRSPAYLINPKHLSKAWNDAQKAETRVNSHLANHENLALSDKFGPEDHIAVMKTISGRMVERYGVMVTWAVHKPTDHGDDRNWHGHLAYNLRRITPEGFGEKAREIVDKRTRTDERRWQRQMFADVLNDRLALLGHDERVSPLSFEERGIVREPTKHLGNKRNLAELKGIPTEVGNNNRAARARNDSHEEGQSQRTALKSHLEAEIHDLVIARLKQMHQGVRKVEIPEHQFDERDTELRNLLGAMAERRESLAAFDRDYEDEQKRLARTAPSREEEMQTRANRGDLPDATDRWAKAMHDSHNPRVKPEENMALAVGVEAEMFRREQKEMRKSEAAEPDPAKRKLLEFNRQIAACDYMAIGAERCASITGFIVGRSDNAISNRDRERAAEWRDVGAKLREDRTELQQTVNEGVYEKVDAFLKDQSRGWQTTSSQRAQKEEEVKEQFYGVASPGYENQNQMPRDLPANDQRLPLNTGQQQDAEPQWRNLDPNEKLEPGASFKIDERTGVLQVQDQPEWRDIGRDEVMPPGAHYRIDLENNRTQVRVERGESEPEPSPTSPAHTTQEEKRDREEQTDAKAETRSREDTTFDQEAYNKYWERAAQETGRSSGMSR